MNRKNYAVAVLGVMLVGTGCQSPKASTTQNSLLPDAAAQPVYTVDLIPNPQLTPTSREGDNRPIIYSSNIVAVYLRTNRPDGISGDSPGAAKR